MTLSLTINLVTDHKQAYNVQIVFVVEQDKKNNKTFFVYFPLTVFISLINKESLTNGTSRKYQKLSVEDISQTTFRVKLSIHRDC